MTSAWWGVGGGSQKADEVREVTWILFCRSVTYAYKGVGIGDVIYESPQMADTQNERMREEAQIAQR